MPGLLIGSRREEAGIQALEWGHQPQSDGLVMHVWQDWRDQHWERREEVLSVMAVTCEQGSFLRVDYEVCIILGSWRWSIYLNSAIQKARGGDVSKD